MQRTVAAGGDHRSPGGGAQRVVEVGVLGVDGDEVRRPLPERGEGAVQLVGPTGSPVGDDEQGFGGQVRGTLLSRSDPRQAGTRAAAMMA